MSDFECSMTGNITSFDVDRDPDGLGDLPPGWTMIRFARRRINPEWALIQQVKAGLLQAALEQVPEEMREKQQALFGVQINAQFFSYEEATAQFLVDEDIAYVSDSGEVLDSLDEIREMLSLSPVIRD